MVDEICRKLTRRQKQKLSQRPDYTSKDKDKDYFEKYNFSYQLFFFVQSASIVADYNSAKNNIAFIL